MRYAATVMQAAYGPMGEPYCVVADGRSASWHWTETEAWDERDSLLDLGCRNVRVVGAPCRVGVAM